MTLSNRPKITITIDTSNDAFADGDIYQEVCRILLYIVGTIERGSVLDGLHLRDINGNRVGEVQLS